MEDIRRAVFTPIHHVQLVFFFEAAPEFARNVPEPEWVGRARPDAVKNRVEAGRANGTLLRPDSNASAYAPARGLPITVR
jgi:hypothetical protein